jgi:hypothetical protein
MSGWNRLAVIRRAAFAQVALPCQFPAGDESAGLRPGLRQRRHRSPPRSRSRPAGPVIGVLLPCQPAGRRGSP